MKSCLVQRMEKSLLSILALLSLGPAAGAADASPVLPVLKEQVYNEKIPVSCVGDIYQPPGDLGIALPAVIVVHGGSWSAGSKDDSEIKDITQTLVADGFVVFDINYRLIGQDGKFPNNIDDVKSAVCFLAERAASFKVDPSRIAVLGVSAGAHLALMAAYTPGEAREHLQAVVAMCPATDLADVAPSLVNAYVGEDVRQSAKRLKQTSPLSFAKTGIPTLLVHGTADQVIPFEQSSRLERALKKAKVAVELVAIQGADHTFIMKAGADHDLAIKSTEEYLRKELALENGLPDR